MNATSTDRCLWTNNDVHPVIDFLAPVDCIVLSTASKIWQARLALNDGAVFLSNIRKQIGDYYLKYIQGNPFSTVQDTSAIHLSISSWGRAQSVRWLKLIVHHERKREIFTHGDRKKYLCFQCGMPDGMQCKQCIWEIIFGDNKSLMYVWKFTKEQVALLPQVFTLVKHHPGGPLHGPTYSTHTYYLMDDLIDARSSLPWLNVNQRRMNSIDQSHYEQLPQVVRQHLRVEPRGASRGRGSIVLLVSDEIKRAYRARVKHEREERVKNERPKKRQRIE